MIERGELLTIDAKERQGSGKNYARKLRREGYVPAVFIQEKYSESLMIEPKWISKIWQSGRVFYLNYKGHLHKVKIQEIQLHASQRRLLHADFVVYK